MHKNPFVNPVKPLFYYFTDYSVMVIGKFADRQISVFWYRHIPQYTDAFIRILWYVSFLEKNKIVDMVRFLGN
jgi:hypothetical protein